MASHLFNYLLIRSFPKQILRSPPLPCKNGVSHITLHPPALFQDAFHSPNLNYLQLVEARAKPSSTVSPSSLKGGWLEKTVL